ARSQHDGARLARALCHGRRVAPDRPLVPRSLEWPPWSSRRPSCRSSSRPSSCGCCWRSSPALRSFGTSSARRANFAALVLWLLLAKFARLALDVPNERSLHERPVPRVGGVAIVLGVAAAVLAGLAPSGLALGLALALAALSFLDDLRPLPTMVRLAAHLAASGALAWYVLAPMDPLELALIALA